MRDFVTMTRQLLRLPTFKPAEREHEEVLAKLEEHEKIISRLERTVALRTSARAAGQRLAR